MPENHGHLIVKENCREVFLPLKNSKLKPGIYDVVDILEDTIIIKYKEKFVNNKNIDTDNNIGKNSMKITRISNNEGVKHVIESDYKSIKLDCACKNNSHMIRLDYYSCGNNLLTSSGLELSMILNHYQGFFSRIKTAFKYIFKIDRLDTDYSPFSLQNNDIDRLMEFLWKFKHSDLIDKTETPKVKEIAKIFRMPAKSTTADIFRFIKKNFTFQKVYKTGSENEVIPKNTRTIRFDENNKPKICGPFTRGVTLAKIKENKYKDFIEYHYEPFIPSKPV